jgi:L-amino acid N-acyltransferase YncA
MPKMLIRPVQSGDEAAIVEIYNHYISHTTITFEEAPLSAPEMRARIDACTKRYPWLVCVAADGDPGQVVGYAYASLWRERAAYRHTAEATVYVRDGLAGRGHGKALYEALLADLFAADCHVVLGCIALPNAASVGLHEHMGFKQVAHFPEVGRKFDQWLDVGYWQITRPG